MKLRDIETVCNRKVGAKGEEKWTFVVGDLMKLMWKHEELLLGCRQKTDSKGKYKELDIEMQKALISNSQSFLIFQFKCTYLFLS